ncbi:MULTISPECIES: PLP-dependent aminotransferase family protein [unclassified Mesorhizobium]|uniref:aminotransferase-like domain-containing protein n=1 Tax=unclassified Mesorhizobium TaxID=325217 RepID=UPI00112DD09B|nr:MULTISPECIES: PLP-dependent aminotransferase family protein [unclassified Mesorhizobium]TPM07399.1 PLP-dependent aminotransferase family protein [Mesorhizobium sp. B2-3-8]TPM16109.1 PLP-dependent aminotransferase family protein [Mesorhizobium sp. B2-3-7]
MLYNDIVDLSGGYAFPACLPDVTREAAIAASTYRSETMQYTDVLGLDDLRDLIVSYVREDGVVCHRDNVMIVNGAKHGLDLTCRAFLFSGDRVIVTAPTYMTALSILRTHDVEFLAIRQDEDGIDTEDLEARLVEAQALGEPLPKLLFDVPDFHNPTGITTSLDRRRHLVALAERFGFLIIEDDPYRRIRFEGEPVAPTKSLDATGVVVALGTASKIVAPGLRIGWVIAEPTIIKRIATYKADGGTSPFNQRIFAELLRTNQIDGHIKTLIEELRAHRDAMVDSLASLLPAATVRKPSGGYFLWVELPPDVDADVLAGLCPRFGVKAYSGRLSFPGQPTQNALRLCYSFEDSARIKIGIGRVADAYNSLRAGKFDEGAKRLAVADSLDANIY